MNTDKMLSLRQDQNYYKDAHFATAKDLLTGAGFVQTFSDTFERDGFKVVLMRSNTRSLWKMSLQLGRITLGRYIIHGLGLQALLGRIELQVKASDAYRAAQGGGR